MSDLPPATPAPALAAAPPANPEVLAMAAMFPGVDESIIKEVLQAHAGNEERAVESLLAMTDSNFVPEERPGEDVLRSQSDLDADFARSLAYQEEERARSYGRQQRAAQGFGGGGAGGAAVDPALLPYQPRVRRGAPPQQNTLNQNTYSYGASREGGDYGQQQQPGQNQGPGIEEQFNKLAVEGQKAFSGFMARATPFLQNVKEKVSSAATGLQGGPEPRGNNNPPANDYNYHINTSSSSQPNQPRTQNPDYPSDMWSTSTGSFTPTSDASSINIYHPSPTTESAPIPPMKDRLSSPTPTDKRSDELIRNTGGRQSPNAALLGTSPNASSLSTSPSARIDFAKLGLLPKQKISLDGKKSTSPSTSPVPAAASPVKKIEPPVARKSEDEDEEDDELSYTPNPFDEADRR